MWPFRFFPRWGIFSLGFLLVIAYLKIENYWQTWPVYYRVSIDFESRGQLGTLNAFVKCTSHMRRPLGGNRSEEYYPEPLLYGMRLPDNTGILIKAGEAGACHKIDRAITTGNGDGFGYEGVPRLTWLRDFDKTDYAEIYLGQESYDQPNANIRYTKARVSVATAGEYEQWRARVDHSENDYIYYVTPRGAQSQVFAPRGQIRAGNCLFDITIPSHLWSDNEIINDWVKNHRDEGLYTLPQDVSRELLKRDFIYAKGRITLNSYRPDGGGPWDPPLLLDPKDFDLGIILKSIHPVVPVEDRLHVSSSQYGIIACHWRSDIPRENLMFVPFEVTSRGLTTSDITSSQTYYDSREQSIHSIMISGPSW